MEILLIIACVCLVGLAVWLAIRLNGLTKKYKPIIDIDQAVDRSRAELDRQSRELRDAEARNKKALEKLAKEYKDSKTVFDRLKSEVGLLEENLEDISFGLYRPHFDFEDPDEYKDELERLYQQKKELIKNGGAIDCSSDWTVQGSKTEGAKMIKQQSKLMLRAFNGEVDSAIARVNWNNVSKMEERIKKAFEAVNTMGSVMRISITRKYLKVMLTELRLTHEYEAKKQAIKDEQRQIREQMRQEELAVREFERAKKAAETEEVRYEKALAAARAEVEQAKAGEAEAINAKIHDLEAKLAEAQAKFQRAVSMAQLTKSGHVYIISNIGSFGDDVFKIGMTRRLEPKDRVDELGDASVPFPFDIHAMIYSDDAPSLEQAFHAEFGARRVNAVNMRKEFFRVSLEEVEKFAKQHRAEIEFTKLAEAREFRETLARLKPTTSDKCEEIEEEKFPDTLLTVS
jgi:hypothetical protein